MVAGNQIVMQAAGKLEWMAVLGPPGGSGPFLYDVTRNLDLSGANDWTAGDAVFNSGTTGNGFIDLYSVAGVVAGSTAGPTIVGNVRLSNTFSDIAPRWAIGNLNGLYGYSASTYGAAFGDASGVNIVIDAANGIRFRNSTTATLALTGSNLDLMNNGAIRSGAATTIDAGTGLWIAAGAGTPQFRVGNPNGNQIKWDGTNLILTSANTTIDANGIRITPIDSAFYSSGRAYGWTVPTGELGLSGRDGSGSGRGIAIEAKWSGTGNRIQSIFTAATYNGSVGGTGRASTLHSASTDNFQIEMVVGAQVMLLSTLTSELRIGNDFKISLNNSAATDIPYTRSDGNFLVIESRPTAQGGAIHMSNDNAANIIMGFAGGRQTLYGASFVSTAPRWADALTQFTIGANGAAAALTANPAAYIHVANAAGTVFIIPAYNP